MERVYLEETAALGASLALPKEKAHYLCRVLRLKEGAEVGVFDAQGHEWQARLQGAEKDARLVIEASLGQDPPPVLAITLAQALPKQAKIEFIWQKAVEIGAEGFAPFVSRHTVVKLDAREAERKHERWLTVIEEACRQSGRRRVPHLAPLVSFSDMLREACARGPVWMAYEGEGTESLKSVFAEPAPASVTLVIGPEGGFDPDEVYEARRAGARIVGLGPRVLRVETAAVVAVSLLQFALGDLSLTR